MALRMKIAAAIRRGPSLAGAIPALTAMVLTATPPNPQADPIRMPAPIEEDFPAVDSGRTVLPSQVSEGLEVHEALPRSSESGTDSTGTDLSGAAETGAETDTLRSPAAVAEGGEGMEGSAEAKPDSGAMELPGRTSKGQGRTLHAKQEVSRTALTREQMKRTPAVQGDPLRALSTLPGVDNQSDLTVRPFVRGGESHETRLFFAGMPVLHGFHFGSLYSVFNLEGLEGMEVYSGGFPLRLSNALSGAILLEPRSGLADSLQASVEISLLRGNGYLSVPVIPGKLGLQFGYQAFWYDAVVHAGADVLDWFLDNPDFTEEKKNFEQTVDLPNFRDTQIGFTWNPTPHFEAAYTGLWARDRFTVLDQRKMYVVDHQEVSPDYYLLHQLYRPDDSLLREVRNAYDTLGLVSVNTPMHFLSWKAQPGEGRWSFSQRFAYQTQAWDVGFPGTLRWEEGTDEDHRFTGRRKRDPSALLYEWDRNSLALDSRVEWLADENHRLGAGLYLESTVDKYHTEVPRAVHEMIVNGGNNAVDALGLFEPEGFAIVQDGDENFSKHGDYLGSLNDRVQFNHQGRLSVPLSALYLEEAWTPTPRLRIQGGARWEWDAAAENGFLSPRLSLFQSLGDKDELVLSGGLYSQSLFPLEVRVRDPHVRPEKAWHTNLEWTHAFSPAYTLEWKAYHKRYWDLAAPYLVNTGVIDWEDNLLGDGLDSAGFAALDTATQRTLLDYFAKRETHYANTGVGQAYGSELAFRYLPHRRWQGWASLEVSKSERRDRPDGAAYDFSRHRDWALNLVNLFRMPGRYELAVRYRTSAGNPYTPYRLPSSNEEVGAGDTLIWVGARNSSHYKPYSRLDLRLSKHGTLFGHPFQSFFEVWNSQNKPNFLLRDSETGALKFLEFNFPFPILFFGFEWRW